MPVAPRATATIAHLLKGIDFPCSRTDILKHARQNGAEQDSLDVLKNLPVRHYANMADVFIGVGAAEREIDEAPQTSEPEPPARQEAPPRPQLQPPREPSQDREPAPRAGSPDRPEEIWGSMMWFWPVAMMRLGWTWIDAMQRIMSQYGWPMR